MKHIAYLLNEGRVNNYRYYPGGLFYFKYKRGELFGTSKESLINIFENEVINNFNQFINVSFDPKELYEFSTPLISNLGLLNDAITVTTISRLEKGYLNTLVKSVIDYSVKNSRQKINFIIGGGTVHKRIEEDLMENSLSMAKNIPNLNIIFTGYISKLGKDLFEKTDIFVGMGTSSINAISQGCATLIVNPNTGKTTGVFGVDTENFAYPTDKGRVFEIEEKLFELINDRNKMLTAKENGRILFNKEFTNNVSFEKLDFLLRNSDKKEDYYNYRINFFEITRDLLLYIYRKYVRNC